MIEFSWPGGLRDGILVTDNALSEEICEVVVENLSKIIDELGRQGQTAGGVNTTYKKSTDIRLVEETLALVTDDNIRLVLVNFVNSLHHAINVCYSEYRRNMRALWHLSGMYDSGFQVQRYSKVNDYYREHVDSFPWIDELSTRALSVVVYLNDIEQGGETDFSLQDIKVKPKSGRICVFPSNFTHPHSGNPPLSSDKWIVSTFLYGLVESSAPTNHHHDHHDHSDHSHDETETSISMNHDISTNNEHYHVCVQCANGESHECTYEDRHH
jgi:hypothetical protein